MSKVIQNDEIDGELEWARRRKVLDAILAFSMGKSFGIEEQDITQRCVGTISNGFTDEEPTGDKQFIITIKAEGDDE